MSKCGSKLFFNWLRRVTEEESGLFRSQNMQYITEQNSAVSRNGTENEQPMITSNAEGKEKKRLRGKEC